MIKSLAFAGLATAVATPYIYFLVNNAAGNHLLPASFQQFDFVMIQSLMLFVICLLSASIGFSFTKRYGLPGLGISRKYVDSLPLLFIGGFAMAIFSYLVFDRFFYSISPMSYPGDVFSVIAIPVKAAVTEELILRFGLLTIAVGICRNSYGGILLVSIFATILSLKYLNFIRADMAFSYIFIVQLLLTFAVNCILGYLCVTYGLVYAMTFRFVMGLKYLLILLVN